MKHRCKLCGCEDEFPTITTDDEEVPYCPTDGCYSIGYDTIEIIEDQQIAPISKAERVRQDVLTFIEKMRFKHGITYHSIQVSYIEDEQTRMTGLIDGSNSFLKTAQHQIQMIIDERNG